MDSGGGGRPPSSVGVREINGSGPTTAHPSPPPETAADRRGSSSFYSGVDPKRIQEFVLRLSDKWYDDFTAGIDSKSKLANRDLSSLPEFQQQQLYATFLRRGNMCLVHRFERRVGNLSAVCYQNSASPRCALVMLHGFGGSPLDFDPTVRIYFSLCGSKIPTIWVLPAGPFYDPALIGVELEDGHIPGGGRGSPAAAEDPTANAGFRRSLKRRMSSWTIGLVRRRNAELQPTDAPGGCGPGGPGAAGDGAGGATPHNAGIDCPKVSPDGGYQWWRIPSLKPGRGPGIRTILSNLKKPSDFDFVRNECLNAIEDVMRIWNLSPKQIIVGGFSQGAMVAGELLYHRLPDPYGAAIILSSAPIARKDQRKRAACEEDSRAYDLRRAQEDGEGGGAASSLESVLSGKSSAASQARSGTGSRFRSASPRTPSALRFWKWNRASPGAAAPPPGSSYSQRDDSAGSAGGASLDDTRSYKSSHARGPPSLVGRTGGGYGMTPIFQAHGTKDPVVPFFVGRYLRRHLVSTGFRRVEFYSFPGGHEFPVSAAYKCFDWLAGLPLIQQIIDEVSGRWRPPRELAFTPSTTGLSSPSPVSHAQGGSAAGYPPSPPRFSDGAGNRTPATGLRSEGSGLRGDGSGARMVDRSGWRADGTQSRSPPGSQERRPTAYERSSARGRRVTLGNAEIAGSRGGGAHRGSTSSSMVDSPPAEALRPTRLVGAPGAANRTASAKPRRRNDGSHLEVSPSFVSGARAAAPTRPPALRRPPPLSMTSGGGSVSEKKDRPPKGLLR